MIGAIRHHLSTTHSTNAVARDLVTRGAHHGTLVTAEVQSAGRGRFDRVWHSEPGANILVSFILHPRRAMDDWGGLPLLAGIAVQEAIAEVSSVPTWLKWPNDVFVADRKLCGILVESGVMGEDRWVIAGIGINVNQRGFPVGCHHEPTSLAREAGVDVSRPLLLDALCRHLDAWLERWERAGNPAIIDRWKKSNKLFGRMVVAGDGDEVLPVRIIDLAADGSLIVEDADGTRRAFYAGDISLHLSPGDHP